MKGVQKDKNHGGWIVNYGSDIKRHFKTEKEAISKRKKLEEQFGKPIGGPKRKDYSGMVFGNIKVIGSTDEYKGHSQLVLVKNIKTNKYRTVTIGSLISGSFKGNDGYSRKQKNNTTGYSGVQLITRGIYKGMYKGAITIKKKAYITPAFKNPQEAYKAKEKILKNYLEKGFLPDPSRAKTNTRKKYISFIKRVGRTSKYVFEIKRSGKKYSKRFNTLNEAVTYRNDFLKEHNLPIPKN